DSGLFLNLIDMQTLDRRPVDQSEAGDMREYEFSPDSQWLAYTKPLKNGMNAVCIYSIRTGRSVMVSTGLQRDSEPKWDPAGKYLFMFSDRHMNPVLGTIDLEHVLVNTTEIIAVALAEGTPAPTKEAAKAAGFDLESWASGGKADESKDDPSKSDANEAGDDAARGGGDKNADVQASKPAAPNVMVVDTEGISDRQYMLAVEPGNYGHLEALNGGVCYLSEPLEGIMDEVWPAPPLGVPKGTLKKFDCMKGEESVLAAGVSEYAIDREKTHAAYPKADNTGFTVMSLGGDGEPKQVDLSDAQMRVTTSEEWNQILDEAWRLQRDFYWAKNYVGVDWDAMKTKYEALLPRVGTREELNAVLGQMLGELGTSHEYVWGGQMVDKAKPVSVGLLGADIAIANGMVTITHVIQRPEWAEDVYSPLGQSYLKVKDGSVILAVNGRVMTNSGDFEDSLQDMAEKFVKLKIADDAAGTNTREITVKTLDDEADLRYAAWVERNRKYVDEKSQGVIGYMHMPDMDGKGLSMFSKLFYGQYNKKALVIDVRDNGGGFVSQMIIERLRRKPWAYSQPRAGVTERVPEMGVNAHMAVLINEHAGSDGDIFPASFKMLGMGPLIGMRTWGGVIGINGDKMTVDMGMTTQPMSAWWEAKGGWTIENHGVDPDIVVDITPGDREEGRDPQLDKAIEVLMEKLKTEPIVEPMPPELPVRVQQ
ncbi:MAG TPA: S41 family peptidase, partial [Phycisphaerales bacterium]|nr:S41 family peptidase [Phycisphaerales bacterium]